MKDDVVVTVVVTVGVAVMEPDTERLGDEEAVAVTVDVRVTDGAADAVPVTVGDAVVVPV